MATGGSPHFRAKDSERDCCCEALAKVALRLADALDPPKPEPQPSTLIAKARAEWPMIAKVCVASLASTLAGYVATTLWIYFHG